MYRAKKAWEVRIPEEVPHKIVVSYGRDFDLIEDVEILDVIYNKIKENDCHDIKDTECDVCIDEQREYRILYNAIMKKGTEQ